MYVVVIITIAVVIDIFFLFFFLLDTRTAHTRGRRRHTSRRIPRISRIDPTCRSIGSDGVVVPPAVSVRRNEIGGGLLVGTVEESAVVYIIFSVFSHRSSNFPLSLARSKLPVSTALYNKSCRRITSP